ncbi:MAG: hypothetical protein RLZ98_592 [Pseudomonadota bacterium]|jgi:mannose-6-phosphate isomerase-like protein (cupin superfamily)
MSETDIHTKKFLLDPYLDWCAGEGLPVVEGFAVDLKRVEPVAWARLGPGCRGAFVHLNGRGDFQAIHLIELAPGASSEVIRHVWDDIYYVLSGHGSAKVEVAPGQSMSFEFGPHALFAPPLNAPHRLFNASGSEALRIVSTNNSPLWVNLAHDARFIFGNPFVFENRVGVESHWQGEGEFIEMSPGKHMWETNFVPDLASFELPEWQTRGAGSSNIKFILADSVMHAHCSEMAVGTYKKAHRHGAGAHVLAVTGTGYTLMWHEGDKDFMRHEWEHGFVFAPTEGLFHQHFNTSPEPARYLACSLGSHRYPMTAAKVKRKRDPESNAKQGGLQIDYRDQDPRIHRLWLEEMAKTGVPSRMGHIFEEARL